MLNVYKHIVQNGYQKSEKTTTKIVMNKIIFRSPDRDLVFTYKQYNQLYKISLTKILRALYANP